MRDFVITAKLTYQSGDRVTAILIKNGIDAIPELTCQDRNRIALSSDLLGLRALGVTSQLLNKANSAVRPGTSKVKPVCETG